MQGDSHLLLVVPATGGAGGFAGILHGGKEQTDEDANDGNHDQQLHQRKASFAVRHVWFPNIRASRAEARTKAKNETKALTTTVKEQSLGDRGKDSREPSGSAPGTGDAEKQERPVQPWATRPEQIGAQQPEPDDGKRRSDRNRGRRGERVRFPSARSRGGRRTRHDDDGRNAPRPRGKRDGPLPGRENVRKLSSRPSANCRTTANRATSLKSLLNMGLTDGHDSNRCASGGQLQSSCISECLRLPLTAGSLLFSRGATFYDDASLPRFLEEQVKARNKMSSIHSMIDAMGFFRPRTLLTLDRVAQETDPMKVLAWRPGPGRCTSLGNSCTSASPKSFLPPSGWPRPRSRLGATWCRGSKGGALPTKISPPSTKSARFSASPVLICWKRYFRSKTSTSATSPKPSRNGSSRSSTACTSFPGTKPIIRGSAILR